MSDFSSTPRDSARVRGGRFLDHFGQLCLPLGLGLIAGYWLGDLGVSWTPRMLEILSIFFVSALFLILAGQWLKGKVVRQTEGGSALRRRTMVLLGLACVAASVRLGAYWLEQGAPLTRLSGDALRTSFRLDTRQYRDIDRELERLVRHLERAELFRGSTPRRGLTDGEERLLRDTWAAFYDNAFALDQIRIFYEDWYHFDPSRAQRHRLLRSYLLTFAAELALYEKSLRLARLVVRVPEAHKFLDAPHPGRGLGEHTFSVFRQEFQGVRDQARVIAGEHYLRFLDQALAARRLAEDRGFDGLWRDVEGHLRTIRGVTPLERAAHTVRGDLQILKRSVRRTWYPAQKGIAVWIGRVETRRVDRYLITPEQLAEASRHLEPGDVLLGRKNWHLSNVTLPGFWPHIMLYIGEPERLLRDLDTPEVRAWLAELTGGETTLAEYLERTYPAAWARYQGGLDGDAIAVLEAVGDGVILNSLPHAAGDYLAALRPRLPPLAKAQAVLEAFAHLGKPYDYDFDFATDHALVCSELVWRSYRPKAGKEGFDLPLVEVAGRLTLPPNEIVRLYEQESQQDGRRFDFVYFLDGRESDRRAIVADEAAFRRSHDRFKWDLLQP